ncbi:putative PurR-regulated permease PerM [Georgenia soli]|uniref:Putative PurR-regulated permease PerM n=1 Tax=Georgenia soli TaxID=638953 RepID=A0A2A9EHE4_9MICO|nr:putative PurR-regulated permease PerM [Georgenia soli]
MGRRVQRRVRPSPTTSVDQVVSQAALGPAAPTGGLAGGSVPGDGTPVRSFRPSHAARVSVRRMPERAAHADAPADGVPRWIRKYGTIAWLLIGIVIVVGMVVFATSRIQIVFIAVFISLVVTSVLDPVVTWLARYVPRGLATVLALLGSFLVVAGLFTYVISSVAGQWESLANRFSDGIDTILQFFETGPLPFHFTQAEINDAINQAVTQATTYVQQNAGDLAGQVLSNAGAVALVFTVLALSLFLTIFFLARGGSMWRWFLNQLPTKNRERTHVAATAGWYTFSGYARGTMIVALADGVMAFILLSIVGVPLAAPLSVLVFIGAFIPLIGAPAAMIIAAVVALAANGFVDAIIVTIGVALIGQIEGHILEPLVMGKQVSLHPVVVALGVTAGTFLGGLLGAIIAIPVLAVTWAVYSAIRSVDPPMEEMPTAPARGGTALGRGGRGSDDGRSLVEELAASETGDSGAGSGRSGVGRSDAGSGEQEVGSRMPAHPARVQPVPVHRPFVRRPPTKTSRREATPADDAEQPTS